jgi:hypothetical protein
MLQYPPAPAYLSPDERAAWERLRAAIEPFGVVTGADFALLEIIVGAHAAAQQLRAAVRDRPMYDPLACEVHAVHVRAAERGMRAAFQALGLTEPQLRRVADALGVPPARAGLSEEESRHGPTPTT